MGCKSRYISPYTFANSTSNATHVCFVFVRSSCDTSQKCSYMQTNLRKIIVATLQSPECGAKNLTKGPSQSRAPFYSTLVSPSGLSVDGIYTVYYHHVWHDTATALDIKKVLAFKHDTDEDLHGYKLCIIGTKWQGCLMMSSRRLRISTVDVTDRTCDQTSIYISV